MHDRRMLPAALLCLAATGCTRIEFRPRLVTQIPDGREVRYRIQPNGSTAVVGRALGWASGTPRIVTSRGDTVIVPAGARIEFKVDHPDSHAKAGGVVGWLLAIAAMQANCIKQDIKYCGEQDPTPVLGAFIGGVIGSLMREPWISIEWDAPR
jgi:hypothetical protein